VKNIKVVGFDCDGVMFDTINANKAYYNHILSHFGKPLMSFKQLEYVHIHTAYEAIDNLFRGDNDLNAAIDYANSISYIPFLKFMTIEPYLKPLLNHLKGKFKSAVATNRTNTMSCVLSKNNLNGLFDLVVTALDVKRPKPFPDPIIKILDHFDVNPDNLIYIGDSSLDQEAARSAGVFFIAYKNSSLSADFHINSLEEVEDILF
jgi:beta-phosphoglucomutase-like phosphatase (HAD superfamily)